LFSLEKYAFFFIIITSIVKKSNPAPETHDSRQDCTVRPRKGAGQCLRGKGGWGGGYLASCETFLFGKNSMQVANKAHVPWSKLHEKPLSNIRETGPSLATHAHFMIYQKNLLDPAVRCLQN
jgi:hypothetical protein